MRRILVLGTRVLAAVVITLVIISFPFDNVESFFYDLRLQYRWPPKASGNIQIILIDAATIEKFKAIPGFKEHALLLKKIAASHPRAVVYTRAFASLVGDQSKTVPVPWSGSATDQLRFVEATQLIKHFYVQSEDMVRAAETKKLQLLPPFSSIPVFSGPKTTDLNIFARDGVSRRALVTYQQQLLLHPLVAALFNPKIKEVNHIRGLFPLFDSQQIDVDFLPKEFFSFNKFEDVLADEIPSAKFKDKLLIIGDDIGESAKDYVSTPLHHDAQTTLAELHANIFDTLIRNSAPLHLPTWMDTLFTLMIVAFTIFVTLSVRPTWGLLILLSIGLVYLFLAWVFFAFFTTWVKVAHPLIAIFISYYFFIPYRLIVESRRSWEYLQKNKLLQQVEELKTNFISLISHDLKTPIARIQGMTELLTRDATILSHQQQEAVDTIRSSSADLLNFVDSILNYARLENQGVQLQKQAQDLNQLLLHVVRRHQFMAKVKHIEITTVLEPLFSVSLDPSLIQQVFSNLLENAIKYSFEGTTVLIRSYESENWICVDITDQGPGIEERDITQIFMKFFRSQKAKNSAVKGSGLGLYLAKYLVELHNGHIFVLSTPGKGATFTVKLPT